jgi:pimeloyl-ACP methyl ester carboxylesterase
VLAPATRQRKDESMIEAEMPHRLTRRSAVTRLTGVAAAAALAATGLSAPASARTPSSSESFRAEYQKGIAMTSATPTAESAPLTVVLVHGAFADSSGWGGVIERLNDAGVAVTAVPNPLRGVNYDAAYVASAFSQIPGPVVAVGHSYGGMVITGAASQASNVVGLVYVAAFAPEEGESLGDIETNSKDSVLNSSIVQLQYPTGNGTETAPEFVIDPAKFHDAFAADLATSQTKIMAATQRPISGFAFSEPSGPPAWKNVPAWAVIPTGDKAAGTDVLRTMAARAGATVTEIDGSHAIMISQPEVVATTILTAVGAIS